MISLIIPCFNEEESLPLFYPEATSVLQKMNCDYELIFVNDGSRDRTLAILKELSEKDPHVIYLSFSRNFGKEAAMYAGFCNARGDYVAVMDADLQDDINAVDEMIEKFDGGCDIVYGVRSERKTDTFFKKFTAQGYYKLLAMMGVDIVYNHADYRLMSRRALQNLESFGEVNLFLRGVVPMIGYKTDKVYYERAERFAGESKYPLKKMLAFAMEGITSLSVKPIRFITSTGFVIFVISLLMLIYSLVRYFMGATIPGWTSLAVSVWAIGGLQLLAIGVVGEYIGKIYLETKHRPKYIVETYLHRDE